MRQILRQKFFSIFCLQVIGLQYIVKGFFQKRSVYGVDRLIFVQHFIADVVDPSDKVVVTGNKLSPMSLLPAINQSPATTAIMYCC
jgi:hypothetical protein